MMNKIIFSTDTMVGYGLDMIFEMAKRCGYDGIDLSISKGFDAWNELYVKNLVKKYELPIYSIQTSALLNSKELNKVLDLCEATGCDLITINAPKFFDFKSYSFIVNNIGEYQGQNPSLHFAIINPEDTNVFALPIPAYRFNNIVDIIKKYKCNLALDIANMNSDDLENIFINKLDEFAPYLALVYVSDKSKTGVPHVMLGDGILRLPNFFKKIKKAGYLRPFSVKLNLSKEELADGDKIEQILVKTRDFILQYAE